MPVGIAYIVFGITFFITFIRFSCEDRGDAINLRPPTYRTTQNLYVTCTPHERMIRERGKSLAYNITIEYLAFYDSSLYAMCVIKFDFCAYIVIAKGKKKKKKAQHRNKFGSQMGELHSRFTNYSMASTSRPRNNNYIYKEMLFITELNFPRRLSPWPNGNVSIKKKVIKEVINLPRYSLDSKMTGMKERKKTERIE